jgi:F0F1-type ATP synthase assembly protein I
MQETEPVSVGRLTGCRVADRLGGFARLTGLSASVTVTNSSNDRSPLTLAMEWTSRVTTISLEMVLPGLLGYWLDQRLGTRIVFLVLGAILGLGMGMWHLIKLTEAPADKDVPPQDSPKDS